MKKWRVAGINFDHMHMGDNLRMAADHPGVELVGICDEKPARMQQAMAALKIPVERAFSDYRECLDKTKPELVILCPATAKHGEWTEKVAPYGVHIIVEKPFAASLAEADAMIAALKKTGKRLAINWPLRWCPPYVTIRRLLDEGLIGDTLEFHHYGGNRGPLFHVADKVEVSRDEVEKLKPRSWFYMKSEGGGSLLDYMGYGATMGTWFQNGRAPIEVTTVTDEPKGLEVDEHSITVARYAHGLSKMETRWGTFTDPWILQPQPKCGFVVVGTEGTASAGDYDKNVRVQTRKKPEGYDVPCDALRFPCQNPVQYVLDCLEKNKPIVGPLSPEFSRIGQQIVDSAVLSAKEKRTVKLLA
ncbi:MAG TPA: Gfo/Idh/MocA family oxidoreductase [Planctomycetota bacterium]|nr:Gfo/Idh/MocA family oxidoreductase [Planctomycetota bacterium]